MDKNLNQRSGRWTEEEIKNLRNLIDERVPKVQIAKILGRSKQSVIMAAHRLKIRAEYATNAWLPFEFERLIFLVAQNVSAQKISAELNRSVAAVRTKMRVCGIQYEKPRTHRPWTEEEIQKLKSLCVQGVFVPQIAKILVRNDGSIYSKCHSLGIEYPKVCFVEERKPKPKKPTLREQLYGKSKINDDN
jgi:hypothetical protein